MLSVVYDVPSQKGPKCGAVFSLVNSPVQSLQFSTSGTKLAVGYESSHVSSFFANTYILVFIKTNSV